MIANVHPSVTSVTSDPLDFLDDAIEQISHWPNIENIEDPFWEAMRQKRADKSASAEIVKKLLRIAAAKGMRQKDFELGVSKLRPALHSDVDSKAERAVGFNGTLWNYYMTKSARMSLLSLEEYAHYFFSQGWLNQNELESVLAYSAEKKGSVTNVKTMFPTNDSLAYDWATCEAKQRSGYKKGR